MKCTKYNLINIDQFKIIDIYCENTLDMIEISLLLQ